MKILDEFVLNFSFLSHFSRVFRLNFNLSFYLCTRNGGNDLLLYFSRYFKYFNAIKILLCAFVDPVMHCALVIVISQYGHYEEWQNIIINIINVVRQYKPSV